ncbi:MAG TPA: YdcF family protein [Candidatus Sulfotelmatobacter sp.]|nr:YdcF family protein [Candidatus Sulfotelmatobacter sp.]
MDASSRLLRFVGFVAVMLFVVAAFTPVPNIVGNWLSVPAWAGEADAIVVLGGGMRGEGILEEASLRRTLQGILLFRRGLAPLLVLLGPSRTPDEPPEAEVRAELARDLGVPSPAILTESRAMTTRQEAGLVARLLAGRARKILLVTDSQHMARARPLFQRFGFTVLPFPADEVSLSAETPEGRLKLSRRVVREGLAQLYYRVAGYM